MEPKTRLEWRLSTLSGHSLQATATGRNAPNGASRRWPGSAESGGLQTVAKGANRPRYALAGARRSSRECDDEIRLEFRCATAVPGRTGVVVQFDLDTAKPRLRVQLPELRLGINAEAVAGIGCFRGLFRRLGQNEKNAIR